MLFRLSFNTSSVTFSVFYGPFYHFTVCTVLVKFLVLLESTLVTIELLYRDI